MSEKLFCNTKEGIHLTAKELGINAYNLGCSCYECNRNFDKMIEDVGICKIDNVYAKSVWNAAIEAAANVSDINSAANIRKLKK